VVLLVFRIYLNYNPVMITRDDIYPRITDELETAEERRRARAAKIKPFRYGLYVLITAAVIAAILFPPSAFLGITVVIAYAAVYMVARGKETRRLKEQLQQDVLPKILDGMGPEFSYEAEARIEKEVLDRSGLFEAFNEYDAGGVVEGRVDNRPIRYSEIDLRFRATDTAGRDRTKRVHSVWQGLFVEMALKEPVPSPIVVYPAALAGFMEKVRTNMAAKRVTTTSQAFDQTYAVYSDQPESASGILSESVLSALLETNQRFRKDGLTSTHVLYSLLENSICVAIPLKQSAGLFQASLSRPVNTPEFLDPQLAVLNRVHELAVVL